MENLVLLGERRRRLEISSPNPHQELVERSTLTDICTFFSEESDTTCSVVLTENGILSNMTDSGDVLWTCNLQDVSEIDGGWFKVDYIDPDLVCLSKRGAVVTVNPKTGDAELVGVFDQGLEDAAWSPDKESLLMVTSTEEDVDDDDDSHNNIEEETPVQTQINSRLMTMTSQFEVLAEVTIPKYVPSSTSEDTIISVTWRPDGLLCGISSVDAEDGVRKVRIYKRESLELHAIGRAEDASGTLVKNLQSTRIAWASTGCSHVLAGVQRKGKKTHQVVFFEPNGLRHREFLLREDPSTSATFLAWNSLSDILAVGLREKEGSEKIQLWHRMNYHWYLKQEIYFSENGVVRLTFNEENPYAFRVLLQGLEWREYEVRWDPSTVLSLEGMCNAFVIDGSSLNVTEFHKALIPPPMNATSISFDSVINDISFCYDGPYSGSVLVTLSSGSLSFLKLNITNYEKPVNIYWVDPNGIDPTCLRSFIVTKTEPNCLRFVCIVCTQYNETNERLAEGIVQDLDSPQPQASITDFFSIAGRVLCMTQWLDETSGCLLQLQDQSLLEYEIIDTAGSLLPSDSEPLLEICPWITAMKGTVFCNRTPDSMEERQRYIFGLSSRSRLYFHDVMLTDSASSFAVSMTHEFLIYATKGSRCQARFLPLTELNGLDPLTGFDQTPILEGFEPRNVEQGSRLVAVLPQSPQMILQMPRGNLEGIHPRALLLRYVVKRIRGGSYREAFRMMRKHKLDLNIIVDLNPRKFVEDGIQVFVKDVDHVDHLNLFISNLQNYDVTQRRFPIPSWLKENSGRSAEDVSFDFSKKVNQVCAVTRKVMVEIENKRERPDRYYLLPILSTFAKEDPPKLDEALQLIKDHVATQPSKSAKSNPLFAETAQNAIHYLAFLAEYELLFETSLGMYDFEIARAVARNSQMDPKVYLPLLKRYNALPKHFSRYEVDMRLKRYDLALQNLHQSFLAGESTEECLEQGSKPLTLANTFEDCLSLVTEYRLYKVGLKLFHHDDEKKRIIMIAMGDFFMKESQPKIALTVYMSIYPLDFKKAKEAAKAAKDWRSYFSILEDDPLESPSVNGEIAIEKRRQVAREIAAEISSSAGFSTNSRREVELDAARILVDYGDDLIGATDHFIQGQFWSEGYRVASLHFRQDLQKKCVDGAIVFSHNSIEIFADRTTEFESANQRYSEVLKLRKQNVQVEGPEAAIDADDNGSLFSIASTASNMSLRSNASASSTGSGLSSVISIRSTTTFQMTGRDEQERHRSKFNTGKKKKQKKSKKAPRKKPGSEEELRELVGVMKASCPNQEYAARITETVRFLIFAQQSSLAEEVYVSYNKMCDVVDRSRLVRIQEHATERREAELMTRTHGDQHEQSHLLIELPIEKEVDGMSCFSLDADLSTHFEFILSEKQDG